MTVSELKNIKKVFEQIISIEEISGLPWESLVELIINQVLKISLSNSGILKNFEPAQSFNNKLYNYLKDFITDHYANLPPYLLGGIFYNALLNFTRNSATKIQFDKLFKRDNGIFFTPIETANNFIDDFLLGLSNNSPINKRNFKILDLASGYGIFSILLTIKSSQRSNPFYSNQQISNVYCYFTRPLSDNTICRLRFLTTSLHCLEKDPIAINISKTSLLLAALFEEKEAITYDNFAGLKSLLTNIKCSDLLENYMDNNLNKFMEAEYDAIISNPPYISYYSRQSREKKYSDKIFYSMKNKLSFGDVSVSKGRINSVMFFMDFACKKINPGGLIGFLTDLNIHENLFFNMRKWLHQNTTLIQSTVNIQDFPGVNSGQTIVFIKNTPPKKKDCVLLIDQTSQDSRRINLSTLKSKYTFYLKKQPAWVYNLENFSKLSQISRINTGINIGGSSKEFVSNQRSGNNFYPIVTVAQMKEKYFLDTNIPFDFVDFNQKKVEELNKINSLKPRRNIIVLGRLERFLSPKLFIRQSAPEIIAGYSDQVIVCPYSIFVLNPFVNISLLSILAILNSRLITEYSRETGIIRTGAGKQPQIRKKGLDNIPVPPLETFEKTRDILENAVKILLSTDRIKFPGQIMEYKKEIEKIVASMYQMNPKDY